MQPSSVGSADSRRAAKNERADGGVKVERRDELAEMAGAEDVERLMTEVVVGVPCCATHKV